MEQLPIVIERTYNAPVNKVWKALTNKDEMKEWYFDIPDFMPEPGFEFEFSGKGKEGEVYLHKCKILEVIPKKKLSHSWRYDGYDGNSIVSFELTAEEDQTHIKLIHAGVETFPKLAAFAKENFIEGWNYIIGKGLREFIEK